MRYIIIFTFLLSTYQAADLSLKTLQNEKRVAYIIGNGSYDESPLDKSTENSQKIKAFLQEYDFEITYKEDASKRDIIKGLRNFNSNMQANGVALFYFSGHMIQVKGSNYLIPIEASIESDYHVLYEAIELDAIISKMNKVGNRLNIIIIDSAFKNPFGDKFHTKAKGLARIKNGPNTDIIFSSKPNKLTKPYPFTSKLLSILSIKGTSNKEGFTTFVKRYPQSYTSTSNEMFFFNLPDTLEDQDQKLWLKTLALGSVAALNTYLTSYPNGKYAKEASQKASELQKANEIALNKKKALELKAQEDAKAKAELEMLKAEQEKKLKIEMEKQALLTAEEKEKEKASLAAALVEEKRMAKESTPFIEPVMVLIKAGSFILGSDSGDPDEQPAHLVKIEKDFYIGRYEVTNVEYKEFLQATKRKQLIPPNWTTDMQPAVGVSWDDANAYTVWLSALTNKTYRLPTEAEWEYSARAGATTRYYWGDRDTSSRNSSWRSNYPDNAHDYAWIKTNSNDISHEVGSKKPNDWGLYDIIGNVWEWTSNPYTPNYDAAVEEETLKVIRGGSWFSTPEETTLSHRGSNVNNFESYNIGFRLLREK